jgi:hypothetical protein
MRWCLPAAYKVYLYKWNPRIRLGNDLYRIKPPVMGLRFVEKPGLLLANMSLDNISTNVKHLAINLDD